MFWDRYFALCHSVGKTPNRVGKELGVSSGTITFWKKGKVPHHGTLLKIADYFGVTVDYLLGQNQQQEAEQPETDAAPIQTAYDNASPEIQTAVRKLLDL